MTPTRRRSTAAASKPSLTEAEITTRLDAIEDKLSPLLRLLEAMLAGDGSLSTPSRTPTQPPKRSVVDHARRDTMPPELRAALMRLPEPKRQEKPRSMPARTRYSLAALEHILPRLHDLKPAQSQIVAYLWSHPHSSVQDLCAALDLKRKTVWNNVSLLSQREIVIAENSR